MRKSRRFFIGVYVHGQGYKEVISYDSKKQFVLECQERTACQDIIVYNSDSISEVCDKMYDNWDVTGAHFMKKITKKEALAAIKNGAKDFT